jgi:uncharacterized protein
LEMARIKKQHDVVITSARGKKVRALVSVFGNVDLAGDRVMPGAFANTIAEWEASGDRPPFLWSHQWGDPFAHLGVIDSMRETDRGLEVEATILDDNEFAQQVQKLLDQRRVTQFSFSYDVVRERKAEDGANELHELRLIEAGPCLSGMNPETGLLSRKSVQQMLAAEKGGTWAGTTISRKAVDDLRSSVSGVVESFLDDLYDAAASSKRAPSDPDADLLRELDELAAEPRTSDADLLRQLDELDGKSMVTTEYAAVLTRASALIAQSAVRATVGGLPEAEAQLMEASRQLRTIASGGEGDVQEIIDRCRPIVQALRAAGQTVAASNLERTLVELAGGTASEYVDNSDRIEGSVNLETPKERAAREADAALVAKLDELSPTDHSAEATERERQRLVRVAQENSMRLPR